MSRFDLTSVAGTLAKQFLNKKKPSDLIPFKGAFPLLADWEMPDYIEEISSKQLVSELSDRFQKLTAQGLRIHTYEESLLEYLGEYGISREQFLTLSNPEKSDKLVDWMNKSCIDWNSLKL